jgi:alcohol dehydrogenase
MKMTAAVMYEQGLPTPYVESKPFRIEELELEGPGEGRGCRVKAAGLCHSDLSQVAGLRKRKLPVVGGHEGAGIVREVGRGVTRLKPGDHVVMTVASGCGHCRPCVDSRPALCDTVGASRAQGVLANGVRSVAVICLCWRRIIFRPVCRARYAHKADPSVPLDVAPCSAVPS